MTSVLRKTREIGLLVAMGGERSSVGAVFCLQGFVIGVIGAIVGWALALVFIHYRNALMGFFVQLLAGDDGAGVEQFYDFYSLSVPYPWESTESLNTFLVFGCFSVFVSTVAGLLPALKAARLKPAEALRSE